MKLFNTYCRKKHKTAVDTESHNYETIKNLAIFYMLYYVNGRGLWGFENIRLGRVGSKIFFGIEPDSRKYFVIRVYRRSWDFREFRSSRENRDFLDLQDSRES